MVDRIFSRARMHIFSYPGSAICAVGLFAYALAGIFRPDAQVATLAQMALWGISREAATAAFVIAAVIVLSSSTLWIKIVALTLTVNVFAAVSLAYAFRIENVALHAPLAHIMVTIGMYTLVLGEAAWIRVRVREMVARWIA